MIYDEGCDPYVESWAEQAAGKRRKQARTRRFLLIARGAGCGLAIFGLAWACLRWLL